jgi:hypothetical protein
MQQITTSRRRDRPSLVPLVGGTLVGAILLIGGLALAYIAFTTPLIQRLMPGFGASGGQVALAMAMITVLLVVPGVCILVGTTRLARMFATVRHHVRWRSPVAGALRALPEGVSVASRLTLPDGRTVSDLVVGPFGAAVIRELPPASMTRIRDGHWELRTDRGWIALENPLERATRDSDRVRRWLGGGDADFVVKVYAAVIGPSPTINRTPACAVLSTEQLATWISGLPAQRSLTPSRQERILETVQSAVS